MERAQGAVSDVRSLVYALRPPALDALGLLGALRAQAITLEGTAGTLCVEITDDGRGLGEDRGTGVGLSSMRERAAELGGSFEIDAVASGGTRVRACLPCSPEDGVGENLPESKTEEA